MAEIEEKERTTKDWVRIILPRVLRAALWGFIMGGELLILLLIPELRGGFFDLLPVQPMNFTYFLLLFVGFEVAIQLLRGTIFQHALGITRTLIYMVMMVLVTNLGVISFSLESIPAIPLPPGVNITFTIEFKAVIGVFLLLSSLSISKTLLQAVDLLAEKAEEPVIPPELP